MSDLSNDTLKRLLADATPGQWEWVSHRLRGGTAGLIAGRREVLWPSTCNDGDTGDAWFDAAEADEALIALAPALAREVLRLRALVGGRDAE